MLILGGIILSVVGTVVAVRCRDDPARWAGYTMGLFIMGIGLFAILYSLMARFLT